MKRTGKMALSLSFQRMGRLHESIQANPTVSFCKRMIEVAIEDASTVAMGRPSWKALDAREWFTCATPTGADYIGSFAWCCEWLGWKVEEKRARVLAYLDGKLAEALAVQHADLEVQLVHRAQLPVFVRKSRCHAVADEQTSLFELFA